MKPELQKKLDALEQSMVEVRYRLCRNMPSYAISAEPGKGWRIEDPDKLWTLSSRFRLLGGKKAGGRFPNVLAAKRELLRIKEHFEAPLTRQEIISHFTLKWIRTEEQGPLLLMFRHALLEDDKEGALFLCSLMSGFTREAIPMKVGLHLGWFAEDLSDRQRKTVAAYNKIGPRKIFPGYARRALCSYKGISEKDKQWVLAYVNSLKAAAA